MEKINTIYLYDGTFEGILTIVYKIIKEKTIPINVVQENKYKISLFEDYKYIDTDYNSSSMMIKLIIDNISDESLYMIYNAFLINKDVAINIVHFLLNGFKYGYKISKLRNLNCVIIIEKYSKMVKRELHRLKGFVRFRNINNVLYSEISPEHDVLELLTTHFKNKLKNEFWIIEDIKRKKAIFYNKKETKVVNTKKLNLNIIEVNASEDTYQDLWKKFIKSITIKERQNLKCQMNFMPKKYWKYMCEVKENI